MHRPLVASFVLGFSIASITLVFLSRNASDLWVMESQLKLANDLRKLGVEAYRSEDWSKVESSFAASSAVRGATTKRQWPLEFPLLAWRFSSDDYSQNEHVLMDESIVAFSMERRGLTEDAAAKFSRLEKANPNKTAAQLHSDAERFLKAASE